MILLLLDLSAAFDTINHEILLSRLSSRYGIIGEAHKWFESYLKEGTYRVYVSGGQSTIRTLRSGVPQGSILGPMLFSLYIAPIGDLLRSLDINFHLYADDTQLYVTFKSNNSDDLIAAKLKIEECVCQLDEWLTMNKLKLNSDKTEILMFSARYRPSLSLSSICVCDDVIDLSTKAKNIGVITDSNVTMEPQVSSICKSGFHYLRKISKIRKYLSNDFKCAEILVHALVTSRLDYANALLYGISNTSLERIQKVQNAAARIVTLTRKRSYNTSIYLRIYDYVILWGLLNVN